MDVAYSTRNSSVTKPLMLSRTTVLHEALERAETCSLQRSTFGKAFNQNLEKGRAATQFADVDLR